MIEFEILDRDLLGKIGKIKTKRGTFETPVFLPVINMLKQSVSPRELWKDFGCKILITNSYLISKNKGNAEKEKNLEIHDFLDFPGTVMTDSGAYQILTYGKVDVSPLEIVRYQETIGSDIATILDVPTGWSISRNNALYTVKETARRGREFTKYRMNKEIYWVGPIQGGRYIDLIAFSAQEMAKLPFHIHALGSPTPVMKQYLFDLLVDMILTAKMNLPKNRPFHLFGAGHPFMFSLAVALGCDMFDSAAYAIFAKDNRYMTEKGTIRLEKMNYFPCSCPVCLKRDPQDLREMQPAERELEISRHNLYICFSEIRKIKEAIKEGRLWEHLKIRSHGHPALFQAFKHLSKYSTYIEKYTPVIKKSGLFFFSSLDLHRPEVLRHRERILEMQLSIPEVKILALLPAKGVRKLKESKGLEEIITIIKQQMGVQEVNLQICFYGFPFGITPIELVDTFPLSHYESIYPSDVESIESVIETLRKYIIRMGFNKIIILIESEKWKKKVSDFSRQMICLNNIEFKILESSAYS